MNNRIIQFDFLKVIAIFLVCYYHGAGRIVDNNIVGSDANYYTFVAYFLHALASIAVPIFFVVNGALMFSKKLTFTKHLKKIFGLILICFFWGALTYILVALIKGEALTIKSALLGAYYIPVGYNNHLWFLKAIILIYLIYPLLKIAFDQTDDKKIIYFTFAVIFAFSFGNLFLNYIVDASQFFFHKGNNKQKILDFTYEVNPFGNAFYAIAYFLIGGFLFRKDFTHFNKPKSFNLITVFVVSWAALFFYGVMKSHLIGERFDTVYAAYFSLMTFIMTISIYLLTENIEIRSSILRQAVEKIGANTLGIYLIHIPLHVLIIYHFPKVLSFFKAYWIFGGAFYAFILLVMSYFITEVLKRIPYVKHSLMF